MPFRPKFYRTAEAQLLLRFFSNDAAIAFLRRNGIHPLRRGRHLLWPAREVERLIARQP
jgi:hypothetical protein